MPVPIPVLSRSSTRRQIISDGAVAIGGMALVSVFSAETDEQQATGKEDGSDKSIALHQEVDFKVAAQRIYEALLDAKQFSAFSGAPATINRETGGAFSLF